MPNELKLTGDGHPLPTTPEGFNKLKKPGKIFLKPQVERIVGQLWSDEDFRNHVLSNDENDSPEQSTFWDDKVAVMMIRQQAKQDKNTFVASAPLWKVANAYREILKDRQLLRKQRMTRHAAE